jgi:hypothetical protein
MDSAMRKPASVPSNLTLLGFIDFQIELLEGLFGGPEWFLTDQFCKQSHPALRRWKLCKEIRDNGGFFRFPVDENEIKEFCKIHSIMCL